MTVCMTRDRNKFAKILAASQRSGLELQLDFALCGGVMSPVGEMPNYLLDSLVYTNRP